MEIQQMIKLLAGNTKFNDITLYEAEVQNVDLSKRSAICRTTGGIDIGDIQVSLMTTIGDGSYLIPKEGSTVYIMLNPLINPFIVHYGEIESIVMVSTKTITLNGDDYGGIVKIQELTDKINTLENVVNSLIQTYNIHTHPVSGAVTGPTTNQDTDTITLTTVTDIENPDISHGPKIQET